MKSAASKAYEDAQRIDEIVSEAMVVLKALLPGFELKDSVIYNPKFAVCGEVAHR